MQENRKERKIFTYLRVYVRGLNHHIITL